MNLILNAGITIYSRWRASSFCVCCLCVMRCRQQEQGNDRLHHTAIQLQFLILQLTWVYALTEFCTQQSPNPICVLLSQVWYVTAKCRQPPTQIAVWSHDTFRAQYQSRTVCQYVHVHAHLYVCSVYICSMCVFMLVHCCNTLAVLYYYLSRIKLRHNCRNENSVVRHFRVCYQLLRVYLGMLML